MKVPMKWLKEYVDVKLSPEEYASKMVMTGTAVEDVTRTGEQFDKVVVGKVITCLLYTSPSPRDLGGSRMPSSA